jgi:hypothetical protein
MLAVDVINFLLGISFAADSSHMEGLSRTSPNINWTTHGKSQNTPLLGALGSTLIDKLAASHCVFSSACGWNLIIMSNDQAIHNQYYAIQTPLNTKCYIQCAKSCVFKLILMSKIVFINLLVTSLLNSIFCSAFCVNY